MALCLADLTHDAGRFELANGPDDGVVGDLQLLLCSARGDKWVPAQEVDQVAGALGAGAAQAFAPTR